MGTSSTWYGPLDFWAHDSTVELWLYLLAQTVDGRPDPAPWLRDAREDWYAQATIGMTGCVSADLDHHLAHDPAREAAFLAVLDDVRRRIASYGPVVPAEVADSAGVGGPGTVHRAGVDTALLHRFTEAVTGLVEGRVAWETAGEVPGVWAAPPCTAGGVVPQAVSGRAT